MKTIGIILIFAGLALISVIGIDVVKKDQASGFDSTYVTKKELGSMQLFAGLGTVLIIAGIAIRVLDGDKENREHSSKH